MTFLHGLDETAPDQLTRQIEFLGFHLPSTIIVTQICTNTQIRQNQNCIPHKTHGSVTGEKNKTTPTAAKLRAWPWNGDAPTSVDKCSTDKQIFEFIPDTRSHQPIQLTTLSLPLCQLPLVLWNLLKPFPVSTDTSLSSTEHVFGWNAWCSNDQHLAHWFMLPVAAQMTVPCLHNTHPCGKHRTLAFPFDSR